MTLMIAIRFLKAEKEREVVEREVVLSIDDKFVRWSVTVSFRIKRDSVLGQWCDINPSIDSWIIYCS